MKRLFLPVLAAALLAGCNQTPPASEQATTTAPELTAQDTATAGTAAPAADEAPQLKTAPGPEPITLSLRFKPVAGAQPLRTEAFLKIAGKESKEINLGSFAGKPDVVDAAKAERAGYPKGWIVGFRSYEPGSGTGADVAVLPGDDLSHLRIMQRRIDESATEPFTFQIARELSLPGPSKASAAK
ncbi:hypothetical protein FY528_04675 [Hymenobacter lutimineralis]|uniref:Lipoprotein n=1 Tax=Hymenobacter lutimineralis TaxID=2606448 RepID=A0A5D6VAN7_9BACT|nr:hypothetical protein [Hymenobacter lutimineralis]TYZ12596.1 hypothetical protein FY528_04675 [Hymenobacter lutimineralis]